MGTPNGVRPSATPQSEKSTAPVSQPSQSATPAQVRKTVIIIDSDDDDAGASASAAKPPQKPTAKRKVPGPALVDVGTLPITPTRAGRPASAQAPSQAPTRSQGSGQARPSADDIPIDVDGLSSESDREITNVRPPHKRKQPNQAPSRPPPASQSTLQTQQRSQTISPRSHPAKAASNKPPFPPLPTRPISPLRSDAPRFTSAEKGKGRAPPGQDPSGPSCSNARRPVEAIVPGLMQDLDGLLCIGVDELDVILAVISAFKGRTVAEAVKEVERYQEEKKQRDELAKKMCLDEPSVMPTRAPDSESTVERMLRDPTQLDSPQEDFPMDDLDPSVDQLAGAPDGDGLNVPRRDMHEGRDDGAESDQEVYAYTPPPPAKRFKAAHLAALPSPPITDGSVTISGESSEAAKGLARAKLLSKTSLLTPSMEQSPDPMVLKARGAILEAELVLEGETADDDGGAEVDVSPLDGALESGLAMNASDGDLDDEVDGGDEEEEPPRIRIAENVAIDNPSSKRSSFDQIKPRSGHRFYADVRSEHGSSSGKSVYCVSEEIKDTSVCFDSAGFPRLWLQTDHAHYRVESVESPAKVESTFIAGVLVQLILRLGHKASVGRLKALFDRGASHDEGARLSSKLVDRRLEVRNAENWLGSQKLKVVLSWAHVVKSLERLIPALRQAYDVDASHAFPPIFGQLLQIADEKGIEPEPARIPKPDELPYVPPLIGHIIGDSMGPVRTRPLKTDGPPPVPVKRSIRSPHEEDAFVEALAEMIDLDEDCIDWNAKYHATSTGVICTTEDGEQVEINEGDCVSVRAGSRKLKAYGTSGPLGKLWYAQVLHFAKKGDKPVQVQLLWFCSASSRFRSETGPFAAGQYADRRELIQTEDTDWNDLAVIRRKITVERCARFPTDDQAWFFTRQTILKGTTKIVSTASLHHALPLFGDADGPVNILDLYAGAGGLSTGVLLGAGGAARVTHAVEFDPHAAQSFKWNHEDTDVHCMKVSDFLELEMVSDKSKRLVRVRIHHVQGGPPCQDYSTANRNRSKAGQCKRAREIVVFLATALQYDPDSILIENVPGLKSYRLPPRRAGMRSGACADGAGETLESDDGSESDDSDDDDTANAPVRDDGVLNLLSRILNEYGYQHDDDKLDASSYGVPQARKRVMIWATKMGLTIPTLPKPTHGDGPEFLFAFNLVEDAISDLPVVDLCREKRPRTDMTGEVDYVSAPQTDFQRWSRQGQAEDAKVSLCTTSAFKERIVDIILTVFEHEVENLRSLPRDVLLRLGITADPSTIHPGYFRLLDLKGLFPTIIGGMAPGSHQGRILLPETRGVMTVRHRARAQSFPDNYRFCGPIGKVRQQIGNAVAVMFAEAWGRHIFGPLAKRLSGELDDDEDDADGDMREQARLRAVTEEDEADRVVLKSGKVDVAQDDEGADGDDEDEEDGMDVEQGEEDEAEQEEAVEEISSDREIDMKAEPAKQVVGRPNAAGVIELSDSDED